MLSEKHRPKDWDQVIGQDKVTGLLSKMEEAGSLNGRAYWITGPTGMGKTTIARILASKISDRFATEEIDAGSCSKDVVDGIRNKGFYKPMTGCLSHVLIVNEAHGLRKDSIRALLVVLEALTPSMTVIFTTTNDGNEMFEDSQIDSTPLIDRCLSLRLSQRNICKPAAVFVQGIARSAGLDGQPLDKYERLLKDHGNSIRAAISAVEAGAMLSNE